MKTLKNILDNAFKRKWLPIIPRQQQVCATQSLINRTRPLIQNAACSSSVPSNSSTVQHTPNHPNRVSLLGRGKGKKRKIMDKIYTHELQVLYPLDCYDYETETEEHSITSADICIKEALVDLQANDSEDDIRQKIVKVCKNKLPLIQVHEFDFVKRSKNRICKPVVRIILILIIPN